MKNLEKENISNLKQNGNLLENINKLNQLPKNFCINGIDQNKLSDKEYLKEFTKGPCSPNIILAGLLSIKLMVTIDCEELKNLDPTTFNLCGWDSCHKNIFEVSFSIKNK